MYYAYWSVEAVHKYRDDHCIEDLDEYDNIVTSRISHSKKHKSKRKVKKSNRNKYT